MVAISIAKMTIPKFGSAQLLHIYCVIFFESCEFFVCPISKIGKNDWDIEYNMWQAHFIRGTDSLKIGEYETICGTLYILAISYSQNYQSCNFQSVKISVQRFSCNFILLTMCWCESQSKEWFCSWRIKQLSVGEPVLNFFHKTSHHTA